MTYLKPHNSSVRVRARTFAIVAGIILVAIAGLQAVRPTFLSSFFTMIARPFWRSELALELGETRSPASLLRDNQALERKLSEADIRLQAIKAVEDENAELKAILNRASSTPLILAAVLRHPPYAPYDELIIDAGSDRGLRVGNTVYAPGRILIGHVSSVLAETANVFLYSSPGKRYDALIGSNNWPATLVGRGGGQYEAELPRDLKAVKGDYVLSPSLGDRPFGVVVSVEADPAQPFETVLIAAPVNIFGLRWVLVDSRLDPK